MKTLEIPSNSARQSLTPRTMISKSSRPLGQYIMLTLPCWFFAYLASEVIMADIAAVFGSVTMFLWVWKRLGNQTEMVRFARLGAAMLVFIQNASWLIASMFSRAIDRSIVVELSKNLGGGLTLSSYCLAIIFVTLFSTVLAYVGSRAWLHRLEIGLKDRLLLFEKIKVQRFVIMLICIIGIEAALVASGIVAQRGLNVEGFEEGDMPAWLVLYESLLPLHVFFNALLFSLLWKRQIVSGRMMLWVILGISIGICFFLHFNKSRSTMTFSLVAHAYWAVFFLAKKPNFAKVALLVAVVYPIVSQAFLLNNFLRSGASGVNEIRGGALDVIPQALEKFQGSEKLREGERFKTAINLSMRPLVATPLALCIQLPVWNKSFTVGKDLFHSVMWAMPGPLVPNKKDFPKQEQLLYANFPIGTQDTADSLYLSSYVDFGWFGVLIYPFLLTGLWYIMLSFSQVTRLSPFFYAIIVATFISLFFLRLGEASIIKWLVSLRAILFWGLFFYLTQIVLRLRLSFFKTNKRRVVSRLVEQ